MISDGCLSMTGSPDIAYQLYKVSFEKFDCSTRELSDEQREDAMRIAERKMHIEQAVLSSREASSVAVPGAQVDAAVEEIRGRYENDDEFHTDLEKLGIDQSHLHQALARELRVEAVLDYVSTEEKPVTDTDISLYYYMNINRFKQPEIRTARHILVTINEDNPENTRDVSLRRAKQIAARLQKKPDRFEEQALKHSECPTSMQGGMLGKVKPGVLYPELESVLYQLKVGQLSEVVESPLGFHLLRCDEILAAGVMPLKDAMPKLREFLTEKKQKQAQRQWLDSLLKKPVETMQDSVNG